MFCKHCGQTIDDDCIVCPKCGKQVAELKANDPKIIINNSNANMNANTNMNNVASYVKPRNKWLALGLCILLGMFGAHKFYEGKVGMGILYIFTCGLFFIGVIVDLIALLFKPNPYYV